MGESLKNTKDRDLRWQLSGFWSKITGEITSSEKESLRLWGFFLRWSFGKEQCRKTVKGKSPGIKDSKADLSHRHNNNKKWQIEMPCLEDRTVLQEQTQRLEEEEGCPHILLSISSLFSCCCVLHSSITVSVFLRLSCLVLFESFTSVCVLTCFSREFSYSLSCLLLFRRTKTTKSLMSSHS